MSVLIDYEAIKASVSMVQVLEAYGIKVERGLAKCPFHADRHPSMKVYKDGYYCFSCGAGGDVIGFVARMDGLKAPQAAQRVAEIGGLTLPQDDYRSCEKARRRAAERRRRRKEQEAYQDSYDRLCAERRRLVAILEDGVPFASEWARAAGRLPEVEGELDGIAEKMAQA